MFPPFARQIINGKGRGLVSQRPIKKQDVILKEKPLVTHLRSFARHRATSFSRSSLCSDQNQPWSFLALPYEPTVDSHSRRFPLMASQILARYMYCVFGLHSSVVEQADGNEGGQLSWFLEKIADLCYARLGPDILMDDYKAWASHVLQILASANETNDSVVRIALSEEQLQALVPPNLYARVVGVLHMNTFTLDRSDAGTDKSVLFYHGSFFNHSCDPNVAVKPYALRDPISTFDHPVTFEALRDIQHGEELTVGYVNLSAGKKERQESLEWGWGFRCRCRRCLADEAPGLVLSSNSPSITK